VSSQRANPITYPKRFCPLAKLQESQAACHLTVKADNNFTKVSGQTAIGTETLPD
jgi:hypothetical protein